MYPFRTGLLIFGFGMFIKQFACWLMMMLTTLTLTSGTLASVLPIQKTEMFCNASEILVASVNRPKLSPCASWPLEGTVIALATDTSPDNYSAFIDLNDTLYVADREKGSIQIWSEKNGNVTRTILRNRAISTAFFVTSASDIYFDHAHEGAISTWSSTRNTIDNVAYINKGCTSLFMSANQALYCSITSGHLVVKMFPKNSVPTFITVAGTGCPGSTSSMLHGQLGIHVNLKLGLYVADTENDRIQFYSAGQLDGTTVAVSIPLSRPTCILLDADDYLYIVDRQSSRIIRTGPRGSECVIGCPTYEGSPKANRLLMPLVASFDSYGNLYVTSQPANGILKFPVSNDACSKSNGQPSKL